MTLLLQFASAVLLALALQAPPGSPTFTIAGTLVERGSNRPLKDAVVTIAPAQQQETALSYRTGEDGRFAFSRLQAGKYPLSARAHGFPLQLLQQDQGYSTAIAVGPGLDSSNILFPLVPGGSITGTVLDEENEPVRQAQVFLLERGVYGGRSQTTLRNVRPTNSSGQFRFPELLPGTYFLAVQAHPWYAQNTSLEARAAAAAAEQDSSAQFDVAYPLTYYAGATDPASASGITLAEGSSNTLQITLRPVPALHIQITGLPPQRNGQPAGVGVMQIGLGGLEFPSNSGGSPGGNDGRSEVFGLPPGRYLLQRFGEQQPDRGPAHVYDLTADGSIDVSAARGTSLSGRITFEGSAPPHVALALLRPGNFMQHTQISVAPDGTLHLNGALLPERYELRLQNAPGFYLKSVAAKGAVFSGGQLDVPEAASVELSLVAAAGSSPIEGVAMKDGKPFGGAMVLLIPKNFTRTDFIRRDQSDSDGTFTLPDVPPGRYTLIAIEDGHDLAYQDLSVMKPYLTRGIDFTAPVPAAAPIKVDVSPRLSKIQN